MQILGIGWENLASLEAPFEIRLDEAPLGQVGLFAITGPTGAGKTTILDAMCLALFDRTPRLSRGRAPMIGRSAVDDGIAALDPRNQLRRGAGSGHATCTFEGRDGRVYKATWKARRARNQPGGKLQAVDMQLLDVLAGKQLGGTKTEVQAAIIDRLGLDFDQFRRSVLLAQGDFAAFLKAGEKERADLLERVTGTEVYAALGRAAWDRASRADTALSQIRAEQRALGLLDAGERSVLEGGARWAQWRLDQVETARAEALRALDVHGRRSGLRLQIATATEQQKTAVTVWEGASEERARLTALEGLAEHSPLVRDADRIRADVGRLELEVTQRQVAVNKEQTRVSVTETGRDLAANGVEAARQALAAQQPALARARALDQRLGDGLARLEQARGLASSAATARDAAQTALASHGSALSGEQEQLARTVKWLEEHADDEALAVARDLVLQQIDVQIDAQARQRALAEARPGLLLAQESAESALTTAQAEVAAAKGGFDAARRDADELATQRDAMDSAAIRKALEDARSALRALERIAALSMERTQALAAVSGVGDQLVQEAAEREAAQAAAAQAKSQEGPAAGRLEASELALSKARAALGLEARRAELVDGESCPLCGSEEHPWASHAPALDALVQDLKTQVLVAREAVSGLREEAARQEERVVAADQRISLLRADRASFESTAAAAAARLLSEASRVGWDELPGDADLPDALAQATAAATAQREQAEQQQEARGVLESAALDAQRRVRVAVEAMGEVQRVEQQHQAAALTAREAEASNGRAAAELHLRVDAARATLAVTLGAEHDGEGDLASLRTELAGRADQWRSRDEARRAAEQALGALREAAALATTEASLAAARSNQAIEAVRVLTAELDGARADRAGELGGRPTGEVQQELEHVVVAAGASLEAARQAAEDRRIALEAAQARVAATAEQLDTTSAAGEVAEAALAERLEALRVDEETLRAQLTGLDELPELRAGIARLRTTLDATAAVLAARRADLEAALSGPAPHLTSTEAEEVLWVTGGRRCEEGAGRTELDGGAERCIRALHGEVATFEERLRRDDDARGQSADLTPRLAQAEAHAALWQTMRDLIGDATGAKFKRFAQSLTLEMLLREANRHLVELNPRYLLERVPDAEGKVLLELQVVDREMGDEIRPVSSLSGGEGFLVSLALALALSSLSSEASTIGSLFIDEGFGTLDADTLEVAIAALEALQDGGRQVGVISHVRGFAEKIGAQVRVVREGAGLSRVEVAGPGYS